MSRISNEALAERIDGIKDLMNEHFKNLNGTIKDMKTDIEHNRKCISENKKFRYKVIGALVVIGTILSIIGIKIF